ARASLPLLIFKPIGKFFETYMIKLGFLDGMAGLIISVNAAHSIFLKYAYLFEKKELSDESSRTR
ncbi:MAG: glycosyltransferase family 2 protein, partial [Proteobacteria bacterium]